MKLKLGKNKFLKIAALVAMLCLVTTCAISTTFAKYATEDSASDTARVAKWGITASASGTLFGKAYTDTIVAQDANGITVKANESVAQSENVVAPGTQNDVGFWVILEGTPEVAYKVTSAFDDNNHSIYLAEGSYGKMVPVSGVNNATDISSFYTLENGEYKLVSGNFDANTVYYQLLNATDVTDTYAPIEWTVTIHDTTVADHSNCACPAHTSTVYPNNTDYDALLGAYMNKEGDVNEAVDTMLQFTWKWDFDGNDGADTILGDLIAGETNIVMFDATNNVYVPVTVNAANADGEILAVAGGAEVACLHVHFGYSVRVEQVD